MCGFIVQVPSVGRPCSPLVPETLETSQDRGVALLVGADELDKSQRVEDLDQPPVGEALLMHCSREGAKSAKLLCVG